MIKNDLRTAWIDEIPDDWRMVRASLAVTPVDRPPLPDDEVVTCFRDGEVTLRSNRRTDGFTVSFQEIGYQHIVEGDLVIHSMDGGWGAIGVSDSDGKASPVVHAYRSEHNDVKFIAYVLRAMAYSGYLIAQTKGIRERSTQFDRKSFSNLYLPLPDLETQRRIADYLDKEISEMDALIEEFKSLKNDLENRSTPFAKRYLDELKDAGIGLTHLGLHASFIGGSGFNERYQGVEGEELPFYKVGSLSTMDSRAIVHDFTNTVSREIAREIGARVVPAGSILLAKVGEAMRLNRFGINSVDCCIDNNMLSVQPDLQVLDTDYLRLALTQLPIDVLINPGPVPSLNTAAFRAFKFPLPNLYKQRQIATSWQREVEKSAALIEESTRLIENLKARKTALITEVVTGRKEV